MHIFTIECKCKFSFISLTQTRRISFERRSSIASETKNEKCQTKGKKSALFYIFIIPFVITRG